jgi:hypothetical protein
VKRRPQPAAIPPGFDAEAVYTYDPPESEPYGGLPCRVLPTMPDAIRANVATVEITTTPPTRAVVPTSWLAECA